MLILNNAVEVCLTLGLTATLMFSLKDQHMRLLLTSCEMKESGLKNTLSRGTLLQKTDMRKNHFLTLQKTESLDTITLMWKAMIATQLPISVLLKVHRQSVKEVLARKSSQLRLHMRLMSLEWQNCA